MSSIVYDFAEIARRRDEIVNGPKPVETPQDGFWRITFPDPARHFHWGDIVTIPCTGGGVGDDTSILTEEGRKLMEGK
jgi:hypothetical protein